MTSEWVFEQRLRALGSGFSGRLREDVLEDSLEWLDHGEWALALEVLTQQLFEWSVSITPQEKRLLDKYGHEAQTAPDCSRSYFDLLDNLVNASPVDGSPTP